MIGSRLAVLGAGSWGTALAIALASRFEHVTLWAHNGLRSSELLRLRENRTYLPGFLLPPNLVVTSDLRAAVSGAFFVLCVVPSRYVRHVVESAAQQMQEDAVVVSATKGLEDDSLFRMSEVIEPLVLPRRVAVLSGPTFAKEVAAGEPAAMVVASDDDETAEIVQRAFATSSLRLYTTTDVVGVELGAALKNVIAIGAGLCKGLGLGSNSLAALVTRGLAEITRLAVAMGAEPRTLSGLAGLGDLVLTATGDLSRNRYVGIHLGEGRSLQQILHGMSMVAEGVGTCRAAHLLGKRENVDLPIVGRMYEILYENKEPREAIRELMERPLTTE